MHETIFSAHTRPKYEKKKKLGSPCNLNSYNGFGIGMFSPICYVLQFQFTRARTHGHLSLTDAHSVSNGHNEINMVSNCSEKFGKYHEKKG